MNSFSSSSTSSQNVGFSSTKTHALSVVYTDTYDDDDDNDAVLCCRVCFSEGLVRVSHGPHASSQQNTLRKLDAYRPTASLLKLFFCERHAEPWAKPKLKTSLKHTLQYSIALFLFYYYAPPLIGGGISDDFV